MKQAIVIGAGPVGSLLSVLLKKLGYAVDVYEKRGDLRKLDNFSGRSINMALSHRGLHALKVAGIDQDALAISIPMEGRFVHLNKGNDNLQPYSNEGKCIQSISRLELNKLLINKAEESGVDFHFNNPFTQDREESFRDSNALVFACDGIHSEVRNSYQNHNTEYFKLSHSYKEFTIQPEFAKDLYKNALHIWPNGSQMFIALPNPDGTFTCTLFLENEGKDSFETLKEANEVEAFFATYYSSLTSLIPDYKKQFFESPTSFLEYHTCENWVEGNKILVGDAAHAIVPFYGQGMNAGFEDCRVIFELLNESENKLRNDYYKKRKQNGDAILELALRNFIEMRDKVADEHFLALKGIEKKVIERYPDDWKSLYEMVTFSDIDYKTCLEKGDQQKEKLEQIYKGELTIEDCFKGNCN